MNSSCVFLAALAVFLLVPTGVALSADQAPVSDGPARLTILYDNTTAREGVQGDWGFACLIEGMGKTILFDTGTKPEILLANLQALKVDLGQVDAIVISHLHGDHTGGLLAALEKRPGVALYVPSAIVSVPESAYERGRVPSLARLSRPDTKIIQVDGPVEVCPGVRLTGQIVGPNLIPEVALLLETRSGGTLVTGCAHPGVVLMTRRAAALRGKPVEAVIGGFHLNQTPETEVRSIIADMKAAGVVRCGATHCTGDAAIAQFRAAFGTDYIPLGVGRVIDF
jgi:7,8-dihydropterin-6-yl-methyl-4-(beta-D-ribofuranosyl)aminobenzene 5'-phosphate synthase